MDDRRRPLDRRQRLRRQRHPVLAQPAGQFRLRDLPDDEHDGREADAERLRGRRDGRGLDVRAGARGATRRRRFSTGTTTTAARPTSACARTAATIPRASSARRRKSPNSTCSAACSARRNASARSRARSRPGPMTYFRASTDDRLGVVKTYVGEGEFTDDPFAMDGGIAVTKVARLQAPARLRRPQRLRAPRGDGARSSRRGGRRGDRPLSRLADLSSPGRARRRRLRFAGFQVVNR